MGLMKLKEQSALPVVELKNNPDIEFWQGEIADVGLVETELKKALQGGKILASVCKKEQTNLSGANAVEIYNGIGIGDNIMALRFIRPTAEQFPKKTFMIPVAGAVLGLRYLDLPPNCIVFDKNNTLPIPADLSINYFFACNAVDLKNQLIRDHPNYSEHDIAGILRLLELGIKIEQKDIESSILSFSNEVIEAVPQDLDIMIAPDAREMRLVSEKRSRKSLSLRQWETVLSQVSPGLVIGILMGSSNQEYCRNILRLAKKYSRKQGFFVEKIEVATLGEVAEQILRAKTFVGMDSGTTHLAYEVMSAAREKGREIRIKELYNSSFFRTQQYALRGNEDLVSVLAESQQSIDKRQGEKDIAYLDADAISAFILEDVIAQEKAEPVATRENILKNIFVKLKRRV